MLFVLKYLKSTISWYTGVKAVMDEDKELFLFSFSYSNPQIVDNSNHDPCAYRAPIVFVQWDTNSNWPAPESIYLKIINLSTN